MQEPTQLIGTVELIGALLGIAVAVVVIIGYIRNQSRQNRLEWKDEITTAVATLRESIKADITAAETQLTQQITAVDEKLGSASMPSRPAWNIALRPTRQNLNSRWSPSTPRYAPSKSA